MHDDFATEPIRGLPERLPKGEHILWQGSPCWWALVKSALLFWWVAGYFVFLGLWRFVSVIDQMPTMGAIAASVPIVVFGLVACGLLLLTSLIQAKATVYTLTNRRVVMRIGAALTMTINLPFTQIKSADLDLRKDGTGTIAFSTSGEMRFAYLVLWPHVRPWHFQAKPALRCINDAKQVADLVAKAAAARISTRRTTSGQKPAGMAVMAAS